MAKDARSLDLSAAVPHGVTTVIFALRADFYARCAEFANLCTALQDFQQYIDPMAHRLCSSGWKMSGW